MIQVLASISFFGSAAAGSAAECWPGPPGSVGSAAECWPGPPGSAGFGSAPEGGKQVDHFHDFQDSSRLVSG